MHASANELHLHTKKFLDVVGRGEEVVVTYKGEDYAKLIPIVKPHLAENEVFGLWKDNSKVTNVEKFIDQLRVPRHHDID